MKSEFIEDIEQELNPELFPENYYGFAEFAINKSMVLDVRNITKENYDSYYVGILNLMKDTINTPYMTDYFITLKFGDKPDDIVDMSIPDLWMNLIMWNCIIVTGRTIKPCHIFFEDCITKDNIKKYIDHFLIDEYTKTIDIVDLNNIIDDTIHKLLDIDDFSYYLANTINLEDFVILMNEDPEFNECIHCQISSDTPLDEVKNVGMKYTKKAIERIKKSKHGLAAFFRAQEGISINQFKEVAINIGTKPDGQGGVFPTIVNTNFLLGGVSDILSYELESNSGRVAQTIVNNNVSDSGYFARLLGINNIDTIIHPDPHYDCGTRNYIKKYIESEDDLKMYEERYYRLVENGMEYCLKITDTHLIGKTILLRSPMTCASHARGEGICYKCYGRLAYIVKLINAGKIAAELMSSVLTQKMLSAKHLLEALVKSFKWNKEFADYFMVEYNSIKFKKNIDFTNFKIIINASDIIPVSEDGEGNNEYTTEMDEYKEYITSFELEFPDGTRINMKSAKAANMYITGYLNDAIRDSANPGEDDEIIIPVTKELLSNPILSVEILNSDLNDTLNEIKDTINTKKTVESFDKDTMLQTLLNNLKKGKLNLNSVHAEVILSNQIRSAECITEKPDWTVPNQKYQILTLKGALKNSPSISVRLAFEGIKAQLYNPLTFKCNKTSFLDLFFITKPQEYLANTSNIKKTELGEVNEKGQRKFMERLPE